MSISDISINRPVFAWMLMAALIIFGGICFQKMGVSQLPDVDFPNVSVSLTLEGASPEVMELTVVDPVEDALMSIQGIKSLTSSSKSGRANVNVEFDIGKNVDVAVQEIEAALSRASRRLPDALDPPSVQKSNPEDQPILWIAVYSDDLPLKDLMFLVRDEIRDRFSTVEGVSEVFMGGYVEPNLRVWVSNQKLNQYSLSVMDVISAIQGEHSEIPAGKIETTQTEYNIRLLGEAQDPEQFGKLPIIKRGGSPNFAPIQLKQVATVEDGLDDVRRISRSMGKTAVGLGIRKQRGVNAVAVAQAVKERLEEVRANLPRNVKMEVRSDSTQFIRESVGELIFTVILSALLTALVCWMFLGSLSSTINVVLAIPTSTIGTFMVLYAAGFTLNTFTLLGLSLAIGIVVDDAIMVLENIVRHKEMGKSRKQAATDGARQITFAAIAATFAIIAVFLPVAFMQGIIGRYFFQFGITISVAVALSLLEALTLTPMRCAQFLELGKRRTRIGKAVEGAFAKSEQAYEKLIPWILEHRLLIVGGSIIFFVLTAASVVFLKKEFVPPQDQSQLMIRAQTPVGSSLELTDQKMKEIEKWLTSQPEVQGYFTNIGGFGGGEVNSGMIFVTLKPIHERKSSQQELAQRMRDDLKVFKGIRASVVDPSLGAFSSKRSLPIEFTIRGPDWGELVKLSEQFMAEMEKNPGFTDVDSDYQEGMPEITITPDREKARQYGVSVTDIGQTVNVLVGGSVVGQFAKGGHRYDIRVRLQESERTSVASLQSLRIRNNRGELIPLMSVVKVTERKSLQGISREERQRAITIFSNIAPKFSQQALLNDIQKIGAKILPAGYRVVSSGSTRTFQESFGSLYFAFFLGILVAYMILASQFNSFTHPITVLVALPFSVSGAFIALLMGGQSLNIFSMIGLILLVGIAKKNSILLVDFTNQKRSEGLDVREALRTACPQRLRPILMTSIATLVGALPAALSLGPGAESRIPMAIAVMGGVLISTLMTLFVVPCIYLFFTKFERPA